jgi:hypothetical protein
MVANVLVLKGVQKTARLSLDLGVETVPLAFNKLFNRPIEEFEKVIATRQKTCSQASIQTLQDNSLDERRRHHPKADQKTWRPLQDRRGGPRQGVSNLRRPRRSRFADRWASCFDRFDRHLARLVQNAVNLWSGSL